MRRTSMHKKALAGFTAAALCLMVPGLAGAAQHSPSATHHRSAAATPASTPGVTSTLGTASTSTTSTTTSQSTTTPAANFTTCQCFSPRQLRKGYKLGALLYRKKHPITGKGVTVAIVAPGAPPDLRKDLGVFDSTYGYKTPPSLRIHRVGAPAFTAGTPVETAFALTVVGMTEYVHVMAPGAKLLVVETPASKASLTATGLEQTFAADSWVLGKKHPRAQVILQGTSGIPEPTATADYHRFHAVYARARQRHVSVITKAGLFTADVIGQPTPPTYPSADTLVTAVGTVSFPTTPSAVEDAATTFAKIGVRHVITTGTSTTYPMPTYQKGVIITSHGTQHTLTVHRVTPDISMASSPVYVYSATSATSGTTGTTGGWAAWRYSEAPALFAGVAALADQEAGHPLGFLNPGLYSMAKDYNYRGIEHATTGPLGIYTTSMTTTLGARGAGTTIGTGYSDFTGLGTVGNVSTFLHSLIPSARMRARMGTTG